MLALLAWLGRSACIGAAALAVTATVVELALSHRCYNVLAVVGAGAISAACRGRFWWGVAASGAAFVVLGSDSMRPGLLFWGVGAVCDVVASRHRRPNA